MPAQLSEELPTQPVLQLAVQLAAQLATATIARHIHENWL